jgi:hypothetical protein
MTSEFVTVSEASELLCPSPEIASVPNELMGLHWGEIIVEEKPLLTRIRGLLARLLDV